MKDIRLLSLEITNFKCHQYFKLNLNGGNASIYGDNASGKTSVYDALTWLLLGKDSRGNGEKNIEIKPLDERGEVKDHDAQTAVEAVLDVNGEELILRRTYREIWATKRGSSTATFDGNTSEYYVNGVPCKKNAFQDKVNELVSEDNFRLLTSVSHFADGISWQKRREELFKIAGVIEDAQILETNEMFLPLVESMGKLSLEDYKKKLLSERKKFQGAKTDIPARISECQKVIDDIRTLDFAAAKAEVDVLNHKKESVSAQLLAIDNDGAQVEKRLEIRTVQLELTELEGENKAYRSVQSGTVVNVDQLRYELSMLNQKVGRLRNHVANESAYIASCEKNISRSRDQWISTSSETFTGGTCLSCGQALPADKLQKAKDSFEARKQKRLAEIEDGANSYKAAKEQAEDRLERAKEEVQLMEAEIQKKEQEIADAMANTVIVRNMDGYAERKAEIESRIQKLTGELANMVGNVSKVKAQLRDEISNIQAQISEQQRIIAKEGMLEYSRKRVEELREDARNAAECLEAIEQMLYLMDEYSRYKTRFVEESINSRFRIARFRMFREQANGGVEDRCDVVYEGIPYISVNNGMKINLGIDIINTMSEAYGVRVPLFVDNAESVTNLEDSDSQIIRLVVSEFDKELRVNYEN